MFSYETEKEISSIGMPIVYGSPVTLSAKAYIELLMAARRWEQQSMGIGSSGGEFTTLNSNLPTCPPCSNDGFGALAYESCRAAAGFRNLAISWQLLTSKG